MYIYNIYNIYNKYSIYIYIYIYICMYVCIYVCLYIYLASAIKKMYALQMKLLYYICFEKGTRRISWISGLDLSLEFI